MSATKLKILITQAGITQAALANHIGIDKGQFNLIVNGRLLPTAQQRLKIESALGQELEVLQEPYQIEPHRLRLRRRNK